MLRVDLRDLKKGPTRTDGQLSPDDPALADLALDLVGPVVVRGEVQVAGNGEYLWRGDVHAVVHGQCRRCLAGVDRSVDIQVEGAVFSPDPEAIDDPAYYPLADRATHLDVTEVVREELALATDVRLVLCRESCAGLCPTCGADLNAGPCRCGNPA